MFMSKVFKPVEKPELKPPQAVSSVQIERMADAGSTDVGYPITIAFDLGFDLGVAIDAPSMTVCGTYELKTTGQSQAVAFARLWLLLGMLPKPSKIVYEIGLLNQQNYAAKTASGGLLGVLLCWCEINGVPHCGVSVGTIKKHATGSGNATKEMMMGALLSRHGITVGDDAADAFWLLDYTVTGPFQNSTLPPKKPQKCPKSPKKTK